MWSNHGKCTCHFLVNLADRLRIWANHNVNQIRANPGTIGRIHQKWRAKFSNFKRLKNREDSSDFDDFLTESIVTTRTFFSKIFAPQKLSRRRNLRDEHASERVNERYAGLKGTVSVVVNTYLDFSQPVVPGFGRIVIKFAQIPGQSAEFTKKWHAKFSNFERLKNREDSSDFDDSWTKSIATTQTFFSKIFAPPKFRVDAQIRDD